MSIEQHTIAPDPKRITQAICLPVRVQESGCMLVDAEGVVLLQADTFIPIDPEWNIGLTETDAVTSAHMLAHALNNAQRLAEALENLIDSTVAVSASVGGAYLDGLAALAAWKGDSA